MPKMYKTALDFPKLLVCRVAMGRRERLVFSLVFDSGQNSQLTVRDEDPDRHWFEVGFKSFRVVRFL